VYAKNEITRLFAQGPHLQVPLCRKDLEEAFGSRRTQKFHFGAFSKSTLKRQELFV